MRSFTSCPAFLFLGLGLAGLGPAQETTPAAEAAPAAQAAFAEGIQKYTGIGSSGRDVAAAATAFRQAAEQGVIPAQYAYGICCLNGYGVEQNEAEAARWLRAAAEQGYAPAQTSLGTCYELGKGVDKNPAEAVRLYQLAAAQDYPRAQMKLANSYSKGNGIEEDLPKAAELYRQAAQNGHAIAQNNIGWAHMNGLGVEKSYEKAIPWLEKAAAQGQENALVNLGVCYEHTIFDNKSEKKIYQLYRLAAEQGFAAGQEHVGIAYAEGTGVAKDMRAAAMWYRAAADQGDSYAQYKLAKCYESAAGVRYDPAEAVRLYRLSAEDNNPLGMVWYARSCMNGFGGAKEDDKEIFRLLSESVRQREFFSTAKTLLGECYERGIGTPKDPKRARELYREAEKYQSSALIQNNLYRSLYLGIGGEPDIDELVDIWEEYADSGSALAMNELGVSYELGEGVEKSLEKAVEYYLRSAKKNNAVARYNLARCYWWGIGVEQDRKEAIEWYIRSANKAFKPAIKACESIGLKLDPVYDNGRFYMFIPRGDKNCTPDTPDPEGKEPLRSFLCGAELFSTDDIPYHPSFELKRIGKSPVAAEDMPPEKTTQQLNEEAVRAGDELWLQGHREDALAQYHKAAEKWDNEARLRLALCAYLGLCMPQDTKMARRFISDALNNNCELAPVWAEYIKMESK